MPADPRRIKELFVAALELTDLPARQAFMERECAGDAELRQRLEVLLRAHDQPQPALDQPLAAIAPVEREQTGPYAGSAGTASEEQAGVVLAGKYKLIERIGEGGMGSVWMAQQTEPVKRMVAVKLIKGGTDSKAVLTRFEAERQALALMDHPNIARVLDAGSTERGSPFFVMELVKGVPITHFCDARKLTPRQRLELFVPVCQAIQHAHQKGIIHRDVKPSNVLIALYDDRPVPKVIDFGVAKATGAQLTEQTLHTGFGSIVGTLEYMSPEQATLNNLDIDTRSDIYSLGVLLYELLAGSVPVRRKDLEKVGMLEMLRIIREDEPLKPSTKASTADALPSLAANRGVDPAKLTRQLRGEIDWMVMKALEKDRARRYETANGFVMDIQRYLADEPVSAGPPSTAYRLKKFVMRNKGQVMAAGLLLLALLVGVVGLSVGLWAVEHERKKTHAALGRALKAEEEAEEAEAATLADYRASTDDAIEQLIGSKPMLGPQEKTYLEKTLKRWQAFAARTGEDVRSQVIRAEGQNRVANLRAKLGQTEGAIAGYREALALFMKLADEFPDDQFKRANLGRTHSDLALVLEQQNQWEKAAEHYRNALTILQKLTDDFPSVPEHLNVLAGIHSNLGVLLKDQKQVEKAAAHYYKALAIQQQLVKNFPNVIEYRQGLAGSHNNLGLLRAEQSEGEKAIEHYRKALPIQQKLADDFPAMPAYRNALARIHVNLGFVLAGQNQWEKAAENYRKALDIRRKLADEFPAVPEYRQELARNLGNFALLLAHQNQTEKVVEHYGKALVICQKLVDDFSAVPEYRRVLAVCHHDLGFLLEGQNQTEKAAEHYRKALAIDQRLADKFPTMPEYRKSLAGTWASLGNLLEGQGQVQKAVEYYYNSLAIQQKLADDLPAVPEYRQQLARSHHNLGFLLVRQNQGKSAAEHFHNALAIQQKLADDLPGVPAYRRDLAGTYAKLANLFQSQNRLDKAAKHYRQALAIQEKLTGDYDAVPAYRLELARIHNNLALLLVHQNQPADATQQYQKALAILRKLAGDFPNVPEYRKGVAATHNNWGNLLAAQNQLEKAAEEFHNALAIRQELVAKSPGVPDYRDDLAASYMSLGLLLAAQRQAEESAQHYRNALAIQEKLADDFRAVPAYQVSLGGSYCNYGNLLRARGMAADSLPWYDKAIRTLTRVHRKDPQVMTPRLFLRNSLWGRARAHDQLEKYAEAAKDWTGVIELCSEQQQPLFRARRADSRVRAGQVAEAVAEVEELTKADNWPANQWYDFACTYAVASATSMDKKQEYASRAIALLRKAVAKGYKDAAHVKKDTDLDPLRGREDFNKLLAEMEAAGAKKAKKP